LDNNVKVQQQQQQHLQHLQQQQQQNKKQTAKSLPEKGIEPGTSGTTV